MRRKLNITPQRRTALAKAGTFMAYIAMILIGIATCLFLFWALQDDDVLQVNNTPVPVRIVEHPTADGVVILSVDYCKTRSVEGRVRTSFVDAKGAREVLTPVSQDREPKNCGKRELPVLIPHELPAGNYKVKFSIMYQINPIKMVVEEFDSLPFEITDSLSEQ